MKGQNSDFNTGNGSNGLLQRGIVHIAICQRINALNAQFRAGFALVYNVKIWELKVVIVPVRTLTFNSQL